MEIRKTVETGLPKGRRRADRMSAINCVDQYELRKERYRKLVYLGVGEVTATKVFTMGPVKIIFDI